MEMDVAGLPAWQVIQPQVSSEAEFKEIASDFGDPLEIVREAISNAFDARATELRILFDVQEIDGLPTLVIEFEDNGSGMTDEVLRQAFWGLGFSTSRQDKEKIGEKGHGTKIYLRSELIEVKTESEQGSWESICERPMRNLANRTMHSPMIRPADRWKSGGHGTLIKVIGYNSSERSKFNHNIVRDYIYWFTKFGSVERLANKIENAEFRILLKCLDDSEYETCSFGHIFPDESSEINDLFAKHDTSAGDYFVRRYLYLDQRLEDFPEVSYDIIISVEGDQVKRGYNPLIRDRKREKKGTYKVGDRYGLWVCKDYIPVERVNPWISFGTGSSSFTLLHAFVNCQSLKLTANRGSIANTSPLILEALQKAVQQRMDFIDEDLAKKGIFTLFEWEREQRTLSQEKSDFTSRRKAIVNRKTAGLNDRTLWEPTNESELFGLFMTVYSLHPELFDFEPVDYNTTRGIDMIARNKTDNNITESDFWYIELKFALRGNLNHGFKYLRYILCWDFDKNINSSTEFAAVSEAEPRFLETHSPSEGVNLYFLNSKSSANKIQIIRLRELLQLKLGISFQ
jgi:hypothetical protein